LVFPNGHSFKSLKERFCQNRIGAAKVGELGEKRAF
jgi:hypothetical protein